MASPAPSPAPSYTSEHLTSSSRRRRRPGSPRGVALWCLVALAAAPLTACTDPVRIEAGDLSGADREACEGVLEALPEQLADEDERELDPSDTLGAAYGDPPIRVTCVDAAPAGFTDVSVCEQVNDVGWYVPDEQVSDPDSEAVLTAMTHFPHVQLTVPADYRPDGVAAALAEVSDPITEHLELVDECL